MAMHDKVIEQRASAMYRSKLPYHNFGHAITVTRYAERIVEKCKREGVPLDEKVVYYALIFHDAGYHEDHLALGFETKEAYSAHLSEHALRDYGVDEETINKVKIAILATHVDANTTAITEIRTEVQTTINTLESKPKMSFIAETIDSDKYSIIYSKPGPGICHC